MKMLMVIAAAAAAAAASAANVCYEGRWLDAHGDARRNATVSAVLAAYESEAAAEPLDSKPVMIATDGDGRFAATAKDLAVPQGLSVFWIGVTPDGGSEIRPRMRVNPAPFALVAATAKCVDAKTATLAGSSHADSLKGRGSDTPCDVVAGHLVLDGTTVLKKGVTGAFNVYLDNVNLGPGGLSMLNTESKDNISTVWENFAADRELELPSPSGLNPVKIGEISIAAEVDAIAMVMIRVRSESNQNVTYATLDNGDFYVLNDVLLGESLGRVYFFTFPVRRDKELRLGLKNQSTLTIAEQKSWAKVKMVYIGRKN